MTFIAKRLSLDAHLACIQIVLDGVGVAHLIVFILRIIVHVLEKAVGTHVFEMVHLHGTTLGGLRFPTAARERQQVKQNKKVLCNSTSWRPRKRGAYASSTTAANETMQRLANRCQPSTKLE